MGLETNAAIRGLRKLHNEEHYCVSCSDSAHITWQLSRASWDGQEHNKSALKKRFKIVIENLKGKIDQPP